MGEWSKVSMIEDTDVFTVKEKRYINEFILGNNFPFYWEPSQTIDPPDQKGFFLHTLIQRDTLTIVSREAVFFINIAQRFIEKHKLPCKKFFRAALNLTYPTPGHSVPHKDHSFPHFQIIMYLNNTTASTVLLKKGKKFKEFMPKQFKIICFPGHYKHYQNYPKTGRRVVGVFTFK
jgi:hypothetical protein